MTPLAVATGVPTQTVTYSDAYGQGREYKVTAAQIATAFGAATTGQIQIDTMPPGAIVQLVKVKHTVQFTGAAGPLTVVVQDGAATPNTYGTTLDVTLPVTDANEVVVSPTTGNIGNPTTPTPLYLNVADTTGFAGFTAGSVSAFVRYTPLLSSPPLHISLPAGTYAVVPPY